MTSHLSVLALSQNNYLASENRLLVRTGIINNSLVFGLSHYQPDYGQGQTIHISDTVNFGLQKESVI